MGAFKHHERFYQYFCFDFYQCKGITWFPLKIKISKEDEIREKSISECIICLLPQRTAHCCSARMSHSDCILNETVLLSAASNSIFVVTHKGRAFYCWFHRKSSRELRTPNFSTSRANLLGENDPGKGKGRIFQLVQKEAAPETDTWGCFRGLGPCWMFPCAFGGKENH